MTSVPDPDQRNSMVWGAWDAVRGQRPEEAVALSKFTADRFARSDAHCVFAEHETVGSDGKPRKYGLGELAKIVRQHSKEQRDIGAFPALTSCHTPDKGDPNGKDPDVLGYSGLNPRLGMIGREQPRWAIFADEAHMPEAKVDLAKKPFRSVELWTFKDGRMRFHPVVAVGAEAPRLQMPAKYSGKFEQLLVDGAKVEKYTVAAAYAGGTNSFVKQPVKHTEGNDMNDQETAQLLAMLQETPQFKFLTRLMEEYEAEQAAAANPAAGNPAAPPPGAAAGAPPAPAAPGAGAPSDDDLADLQDLLGQDDPPKPNAPPPADKPPEKNTVANNPNVVSMEKYTALHSTLTKQSERIVALERVAADATRRQKLNELATKFPMIVDVDDEAKVCLYSLGSKMTDDQFNAHVATVEKYGQRFADSPMIPRGEMPERYIAQSQAEKYEARLADEAVKIHGEIVRREHRQPSYDECEAEAKKRLGGK